MRYAAVSLRSTGYALPECVVTSEALEDMLAPIYARLKLSRGTLAHLTGISARRWWPEGFPLEEGAARAGAKALQSAGLSGGDLDMLIYAGVGRTTIEPAMAAAVGASLGVSYRACVYDVSNACLGMLNGMIAIANAIELGQADAGMVVAAESAREIMLSTIDALSRPDGADEFWSRFAVFTGGSGAAAVILARPDGGSTAPSLLCGAEGAALMHHGLSRWSYEPAQGHLYRQSLVIDGLGTLKHGLDLGAATWHRFLDEMGWQAADIDRVICHQVGREHQTRILERLGVPRHRDFSTYETLGNMGSVSVALTAAVAAEQGSIQPSQRVAWLGIGSGLNCLMLGFDWA